MTPEEPGVASYPGLGSIAEEAGRLLHAAQLWAQRTFVAGQPSERAAHDHGSECHVCPVCQGLALLHERSPELYAHVADALAAVTTAARSLVEHGLSSDEADKPQRDDRGDRPGPRSAMQRIDVT